MFTLFQILLAGYLVFGTFLFLASAYTIACPTCRFQAGGIIKDFAALLQESEKSRRAIGIAAAGLITLYFLSVYLNVIGFFMAMAASAAVLYTVVHFDADQKEREADRSFGNKL